MPKLKPAAVAFSRRLRCNLTDAEKLLWHHLRLRQIGGAKFRRQHPVGKYVLDFVCLEHRLAVEVDGTQHIVNAARDVERDAYLAAEGYRVLRFWDNDILREIDGVKAEIWRALNGQQPPPP